MDSLTAMSAVCEKELDGNPSSGHVLTGEILAEHDGVEAMMKGWWKGRVGGLDQNPHLSIKKWRF